MTIKHTATASNGQTFKRGSANRTYTHVVIARRCKTHAVAQATSKYAQEQDARNYAYYLGEGHAAVANYSTAEAYVAAKMADRLAKIEAADFNLFSDGGWAGRLDLAQKNASSLRARPYYAEVLILPAVIA